jgi:hypothetical protein
LTASPDVHDGKARDAGPADVLKQLAHAGRSVLRLLHSERNEVAVARIEVPGPPAESGPGNSREFTSTCVSRPLTGIRTTAPSALVSVASAGAAPDRRARDSPAGRPGFATPTGA